MLDDSRVESYNDVMKRLLSALFLGLLLTGASSAGPSQSTTPESANVVTRGELSRDLQGVLQRMESEHQQYATKREMNELRSMVEEMRRELSGTERRTQVLESNNQSLQERVDHSRRPGL